MVSPLITLMSSVIPSSASCMAASIKESISMFKSSLPPIEKTLEVLHSKLFPSEQLLLQVVRPNKNPTTPTSIKSAKVVNVFSSSYKC